MSNIAVQIESRWRAVLPLAICLLLVGIATASHGPSTQRADCHVTDSANAALTSQVRVLGPAGSSRIAGTCVFAPTVPQMTASGPELFGESNDEQVVTNLLLPAVVGFFAQEQQASSTSYLQQPLILTAHDRCVLLCHLTL